MENLPNVAEVVTYCGGGCPILWRRLSHVVAEVVTQTKLDLESGSLTKNQWKQWPASLHSHLYVLNDK